MRFLLLSLTAAVSLAACAPSSPPTAASRAPDTPPGARIDDPRYRDAMPNTDPSAPRRTPASRAAGERVYAPIMTE